VRRLLPVVTLKPASMDAGRGAMGLRILRNLVFAGLGVAVATIIGVASAQYPTDPADPNRGGITEPDFAPPDIVPDPWTDPYGDGPDAGVGFGGYDAGIGGAGDDPYIIMERDELDVGGPGTQGPNVEGDHLRLNVYGPDGD
jgi:hypothetical protein